ncbi:hypothetical protein AMAG_00091 [Allomyces macrogynus ATCC 38327]|uniref:Ubiquitin-like domain-containing protein n=1 Tax=Allomyces macrogynus (strain ATCC 38327) TaxID=578462 RepID=A0A0L0RVD1_ALLM3|nr:hypothetical protein AMAG_00091 [Allomyces macrogynus ATCC 38327]|eukprot:KNE54089.1 hypothetical protein AMAG_00091 [Allomyces macrogynus ATCC 38327]
MPGTTSSSRRTTSRKRPAAVARNGPDAVPAGSPSIPAPRATPPAPPSQPCNGNAARPAPRLPPVDPATAQFLERDLDLSALASSLKHARHPSIPGVDLVLHEYRRFLLLKVAYKDEFATILAAPPPIALVWHLHILDTQAYAAMNARLPFFLHHKLSSTNDTAERARHLATSREYYRTRWGDPPKSVWDPPLLSPPTPRPPPATAAPQSQSQSKPAQDTTGKKLRFRVRFLQEDKDIEFIIGPNTTVGKVKAAIADRWPYDAASMQFTAPNGERLADNVKLMAIGLVDDDVLLAEATRRDGEDDGDDGQ